jgi:hypothetical protein
MLCVEKPHHPTGIVGKFKIVAILAIYLIISGGIRQQAVSLQSADNPDFMLRLNFGAAKIKRHRVCAVEGLISHSYHFKLPEARRRETERGYLRRNITLTCAADMNCTRLHSLARAIASMTDNMRQATITLINRTEDLIPAFKPETPTYRRRVSKAVKGILGDFLHWLAGVSTNPTSKKYATSLTKLKR